jgi:hypothetical protein
LTFSGVFFIVIHREADARISSSCTRIRVPRRIGAAAAIQPWPGSGFRSTVFFSENRGGAVWRKVHWSVEWKN